MELHNIDFLATNLFSKKFNDYVSDSHSLSIEKINSFALAMEDHGEIWILKSSN